MLGHLHIGPLVTGSLDPSVATLSVGQESRPREPRLRSAASEDGCVKMSIDDAGHGMVSTTSSTHPARPGGPEDSTATNGQRRMPGIEESSIVPGTGRISSHPDRARAPHE